MDSDKCMEAQTKDYETNSVAVDGRDAGVWLSKLSGARKTYTSPTYWTL